MEYDLLTQLRLLLISWGFDSRAAIKVNGGLPSERVVSTFIKQALTSRAGQGRYIYTVMVPFIFAHAAHLRRQRSSDNSIISSHMSYEVPDNTPQHHATTNNAMPQNMPLGDLEAGHGRITYLQFTPPPSYIRTPPPSTPAPSYYSGRPLHSAPASNNLRPYVNVTQQIRRRPVPPPSRRSLRRRCWRCCGVSGCRFKDVVFWMCCFLVFALAMVGFPLLLIGLAKERHEAQLHCRAVEVAIRWER